MLKIVLGITLSLFVTATAYGAGPGCRKAKSQDACAAKEGCNWDVTKNKCNQVKTDAKTKAEKKQVKKVDKVQKEEKVEEAPAEQDWEMELDAPAEGGYDDAPVDTWDGGGEGTNDE